MLPRTLVLVYINQLKPLFLPNYHLLKLILKIFQPYITSM